MDIRQCNIQQLVEKQKVSKKDVHVLKDIIKDLTHFFNTKNALVKKYNTGKRLFDEMDEKSDRELKLIFNENARPKGAHIRTYNKPCETEVTDMRINITELLVTLFCVCGVCFDDSSSNLINLYPDVQICATRQKKNNAI